MYDGGTAIRRGGFVAMSVSCGNCMATNNVAMPPTNSTKNNR